MLLHTLILLCSLAIISAECPEGCNRPVAIYKDLRCTPIYEKPTDCCPKEFDCSNIAKRNPQKCTYRGKEYAVGDSIPQEETYGNCKIGCHCNAPDFIDCAILDCPEWLGQRPKPNYYFTYTLDKCCSTGQKTAPYETCKVGDKEYKEGQRFSAPKRCTECVCGKGFAGKFESPFCMEQTCVEEMSSMDKMKQNCAPTYFGDDSCCPFDWICPTDNKGTEKIIPSAGGKANQGQCKYGDKVLNIGDKLERDEPISEYNKFEIRCECAIPPWLECKRKQVFDLDKTPQHIKDALKL